MDVFLSTVSWRVVILRRLTLPTRKDGRAREYRCGRKDSAAVLLCGLSNRLSYDLTTSSAQQDSRLSWNVFVSFGPFDCDCITINTTILLCCFRRLHFVPRFVLKKIAAGNNLSTIIKLFSNIRMFSTTIACRE